MKLMDRSSEEGSDYTWNLPSTLYLGKGYFDGRTLSTQSVFYLTTKSFFVETVFGLLVGMRCLAWSYSISVNKDRGDPGESNVSNGRSWGQGLPFPNNWWWVVGKTYVCFLSVGDHWPSGRGKVYTWAREWERWKEVIFPHPFGNILVCIKG